MPVTSYTSGSFTPDNLIVGECLSRQITLLSGQNLVRGSVLGKIAIGTATAAAKAGGNTGSGTLVMDVTTPTLAFVELGIYTVRCITAAANAATFRVTNPTGRVIGDVSFSGSGASATFANGIKFAITDGATDFIVGDGFDITVAAGSGKYVLSLAAAIDGSQVPDLILAEDTDASATDKLTVAYHDVDVLEARLTLGAGHTLDSIREGLRVKDIQLIKSVGI